MTDRDRKDERRSSILMGKRGFSEADREDGGGMRFHVPEAFSNQVLTATSFTSGRSISRIKLPRTKSPVCFETSTLSRFMPSAIRSVVNLSSLSLSLYDRQRQLEGKGDMIVVVAHQFDLIMSSHSA